jgi:hypothetical protein
MERGDSGGELLPEIQGLKRGRAEIRYTQLRGYRDVWLERARRSSRLTIPFLIPETDEILMEAAREQALPWNGLGAMGVNNLCSRLLLALLPPTGGLFRLTKDELKAAQEEAMAAQQGAKEEDLANQKIEVEKALALLDRSIERSIATSNDRVALFEALMHLIVGGAVMLYRSPAAMKCFHLNKHVLLRDPMGRQVEAVTCETYLYASLDPKLKAVLDEADKQRGSWQNEDTTRRDNRRIKVFTHIKWTTGAGDSPGTVAWHQEIGGYIVPDSEGDEPADASPWMPLRLFRIDGDSYGPGYVEWCAIADLSNLDATSQAVTEGCAAAARQLVGRKPSAITSKETFAAAPNLSAIDGQPGDFFPIETSSVRDLGVAFQKEAHLEDRLSKIFLLPNIRQSERTTAEEVRLQITQIEQMLGSIYSILTVEFQYPYVRRVLGLLRKSNKLPDLPGVEPLIVIGLAALGRQSDAERLNQFAMGGNQAMPQQFGSLIDGAAWARQWATAIGVDPMLVKSAARIQEEQAAAAQQAQQQQLIQAGMGDPQKLANAGMAVQQMAGGGPPDGQPAQSTPPEMQP